MKLELKHLAPYLPYGLKIRTRTEKYIYTSKSYSESFKTLDYKNINSFDCGKKYNDIKPILRPLSECRYLQPDEMNSDYVLLCCFNFTTQLISEHFDVFGLIDKGLAIDINSLT